MQQLQLCSTKVAYYGLGSCWGCPFLDDLFLRLLRFQKMWVLCCLLPCPDLTRLLPGVFLVNARELCVNCLGSVWVREFCLFSTLPCNNPYTLLPCHCRSWIRYSRAEYCFGLPGLMSRSGEGLSQGFFALITTPGFSNYPLIYTIPSWDIHMTPCIWLPSVSQPTCNPKGF